MEGGTKVFVAGCGCVLYTYLLTGLCAAIRSYIAVFLTLQELPYQGDSGKEVGREAGQDQKRRSVANQSFQVSVHACVRVCVCAYITTSLYS